MVKVYYDADCNLDLLKGKTVAIIGFGSQGHAHAQNLHDSGIDVVVGLRPGSKSRAKAEEAGLKVMDTADAAKAGDVVMILAPDQNQPDIYEKDIKPNLEPGNMLMFAHGFSIHFKQIVAPEGVDVTMCAPKGPGHTVRSQYLEGKGVPSLRNKNIRGDHYVTLVVQVPTKLNEEAKEALRKFDEACGNRPATEPKDGSEKSEKKKKSFMDKIKETFED